MSLPIRLYLILCAGIISYSAVAQPQQRIIRGTWITNVASEAMRSPEKIRETVIQCKKKV